MGVKHRPHSKWIRTMAEQSNLPPHPPQLNRWIRLIVRPERVSARSLLLQSRWRRTLFQNFPANIIIMVENKMDTFLKDPMLRILKALTTILHLQHIKYRSLVCRIYWRLKFICKLESRTRCYFTSLQQSPPTYLLIIEYPWMPYPHSHAHNRRTK